MNVIRPRQGWIEIVSLICAAVVLAGCATRPKIDWNTRVGQYTFDQAVTELGPPDKQATLRDGSVVAEWMTRRGYWHGSAGYMYPLSPWHYGTVYPDYMETYSPDYFLRLTFGPNGQLESWKTFAR